MAKITHSTSEQPQEEAVSAPSFVRKASSQPRVKVPLKSEKDKYETF